MTELENYHFAYCTAIIKLHDQQQRKLGRVSGSCDWTGLMTQGHSVSKMETTKYNRFGREDVQGNV